jgi:hypothetical protein
MKKIAKHKAILTAPRMTSMRPYSYVDISKQIVERPDDRTATPKLLIANRIAGMIQNKTIASIEATGLNKWASIAVAVINADKLMA